MASASWRTRWTPTTCPSTTSNTTERSRSWRGRIGPGYTGIEMRAEFAQAMLLLLARRKDLVFVTGDLGYLAFEGLAQAYGERFVNAGVAEQNAVSLAAGLARAGHLPWVYSMAAFAVLRPYEQIRDDVCLHRLPVKLPGNGGGSGHRTIGAAHH